MLNRPNFFISSLAVLLLAPAVMAQTAFNDIRRRPDAVTIETDKTAASANREGDDWVSGDVRVTTTVTDDGVRVRLASPTVPVRRIRLRWDVRFAAGTKMSGDAWERTYADQEWKVVDPRRPMPWYFLATDGGRTDGFGVATGPASMCCWRADPSWIELTADVRSGGVGVELGGRTLDACTVVYRSGQPSESPFVAAQQFCRQMCPRPRLPKQPVYGFNDWYCDYGHNTAEKFLADAAFIASLSPAGDNRPFMVIDDGWQANRQHGDVIDDGWQAKRQHVAVTGDPWDRTNPAFGSTMPAVATAIKAMNARPGLWYRPLEAWPDAPESWRLKNRLECFDPTVPEVRKNIADNLRRFHSWGYELVKHDFTTNELTGQWGRDMGDKVGGDGWSFADRTRTTAEIILDLYRTIREGAGDDVLIDGCDTIGHLAAGVFELQRIGDDTSGNEWRRTRDYGVNTLAFRASQHGAFYFVDADCAGLAAAGAVPWEKNRQWLDLLSRSGTPLFVSWPKRLIGPEQETALRAALSAASKTRPVGEPVDWFDTRTPTRWILDGQPADFSW